MAQTANAPRHGPMQRQHQRNGGNGASQIPVAAKQQQQQQPQRPPSPSAFPSLGGLAKEANGDAGLAAPPPAANGLSYARASKAVLPEAPQGSAVSRIQPSSTGPTSPYSRPAAAATPAQGEPSLARAPGSKRTSVGGQQRSKHRKTPSTTSSHRKSTSYSSPSRLPQPQQQANGQLPLTPPVNDARAAPSLLHPASPKSSSLSPLAPSFSFKPRTSTSPPPAPATSSSESQPMAEHLSPLAQEFQPTSSGEASPSSASSQSDAGDELEVSEVPRDDPAAAVAGHDSAQVEAAPIGLGVSAADTNGHEETEAEAEEPAAASEAVPSTEQEPATTSSEQVEPTAAIDEQDSSRSDLVKAHKHADASSATAAEEAATAPEKDVVEPSESTPLPEPLVRAMRISDSSAVEDANTVIEDEAPEKPSEVSPRVPEVTESTPLPEPLVHATENSAKAVEGAEGSLSSAEHGSGEPTAEDRGKGDAMLPAPLVHATLNIAESAEAGAAETDNASVHEAEVTQSTPLPEPLVHATEVIAKHAEEDARPAEEPELATSAEQLPARSAELEANADSTMESAEAPDIPVTAEQIIEQQTLDDVLDVDEVPADRLQEEMEKSAAPVDQSASDEQQNLESQELRQEEISVAAQPDPAPSTAAASDTPNWEPFEDSEPAPAAVSQTTEEVEPEPEPEQEQQDDEDDSSATPRPAPASAAADAVVDAASGTTSSVPEESQPAPSAELPVSSSDAPANAEDARKSSSTALQPVDKNDGSDSDSDEERTPARHASASDAPSLTMAIVNAWHSTTWAKRIPAVIASVAINVGLPFVNGVMLGFGELFARNFIGIRLGWGNPFRAPGLSSQPAASGTRANTSNVGLRGSSSSSTGHPLTGSAGVRTTVEAVEAEVGGAMHSG